MDLPMCFAVVLLRAAMLHYIYSHLGKRGGGPREIQLVAYLGRQV